jgi:tripartite-type tricarboxylate transporter receptor subunit TctC
VADFTHIAMLAEAPTVSVVRANSPFATMPALIDAARQRPVRFGSSGVGSAEHFSGALLARATGASQLDHIPYRGTAPALQDLLAGQIDMLNAPITTLVGQLRDGSLRLIATSSEARISAFPNVPTLAELGAPQATHTQWIGLSAPRGLPAPVVVRLWETLAPIQQSAAVQARLAEFASMPRSPVPSSVEFARFVAAFRDHWVAMAKAEGIVAS